MKSLRRHLINLFLRAQKLLQRNASIDSVRRLSRWSEKLFSIPKDVYWEKFIRNEQAYEWLIPNEINSEYVIFYIHGGFVFPLYNPTRYLAGYLARLAGMRARVVDGFLLGMVDIMVTIRRNVYRAYIQGAHCS